MLMKSFKLSKIGSKVAKIDWDPPEEMLDWIERNPHKCNVTQDELTFSFSAYKIKFEIELED